MIKKLLQICAISIITLNVAYSQINYQWNKKVGSTDNDNVKCVATDKKGFVYISGTVKGSATGDFTIPFTNGANTYDSYFAKLDHTGNAVWIKNFNAPTGGAINIFDIAVNDNGTIFIAGNTGGSSNIDLNTGTGTANVLNTPFMAAYNSNGDFLWGGAVGGSNSNLEFKKIKIRANGDPVFGGTYINANNISNLDMNYTATVSNVNINNTGLRRGPFLIKCTEAGVYEGTLLQALSSPLIEGAPTNYQEDASLVDFEIMKNGNIVVAGFKPWYLVSGNNAVYQGSKFFIQKYYENNSTPYSTVQMLATQSGASLAGVELDSVSNIYIAGYAVSPSGSPVDLDPGAGTANLVGTFIPSTVGFIAKYDSSIAYSTHKQIFSSANQASSDKCLISQFNITDNQILIAGTMAGTIDFDPSANTNNLTATATTEAFLGSYNVSDLSFNNVFKYGIASTTVNSLSVSAGKNIYLASTFDGTIADIDPSANTQSVTSTGLTDGLLAKYYVCDNKMVYDGSYTPVNVCEGANTMLTVKADFPAAAYQWSRNSQVLVGKTKNYLEFTNVAISDTGLYSVSVTSACDSRSALLWAKLNVEKSPTITLSGDTAICKTVGGKIIASGADTYLWNTASTNDTISVNPTTNTTYTVTGTSINGCKATKSILLKVNTPYTVTISGKTTVCNGNYDTLTVTKGRDYLWGGGQTTQTIIEKITANKTFTVTVTDSINGCKSNASLAVTMANQASFGIVASNNNTVCPGASLNLSTSAPFSSYKWKIQNNNTVLSTAATFAITPSDTTTYQVDVIPANGCVSSAIKKINVYKLTPLTITGNTQICSNSSTTLTASGASSYKWSANTNGATVAAVTVTPTSTSTVYEVTGTYSPSACTTKVSKTVTVFTFNISGTPNSGANFTNVCPGQVVKMKASSPSYGNPTYVWSNGSTKDSSMYSSKTSVTISVVGTSSVNNCTATRSWSYTVTPVNVGVTKTANGLTANSTVVGATFKWIDCDNNKSLIQGATAKTYTPTTTGNYAVIVTENNCSDTSACTNFTVSVTGIESNANNQIKVYPNPVKDNLFFTGFGELYSLVGNKVAEGTEIIAVEKLEAGIYLLKIDNNLFKIIKE